jgi:DNA-3-methyladenine glycosylase I
VSSKEDTFLAPDGAPRCFWASGPPEMLAYHDAEWGMPVDDDVRLFEKLCLEGFQSGLSWLTILRTREGFRRAFDGFDPAKVARYGAAELERLLGDAAIVRHRGKIEAAIGNAEATLRVKDAEGSLAALVWRFEPSAGDRPERVSRAALPSTSPASVALSRELKRRGFRFIGPTTAYAFMQAMGLVDDHMHACATRARVEEARRRFRRPGGP